MHNMLKMTDAHCKDAAGDIRCVEVEVSHMIDVSASSETVSGSMFQQCLCVPCFASF